MVLWISLAMLCSVAFAQDYQPNTTRKIRQITGNTDTPLRRPTVTQTGTSANVLATDLGSSFEHNGNLYFLFGDTVGRTYGTEDCLAYTSATSPEGMQLTFPKDGDGKFRVINIPGVSQGGMEVPSGGISYGGNIFLVHTTDWNGNTGNMERSVMARSTNNGWSWTYLYDLSKATNNDMTNSHFINVSMSIVNSSTYPALPYAGDNLLIFGSGAYRSSNVYLAVMPANGIATRSNLRYLSGFNGSTPIWSVNESAAIPLFSHPQVGEFSAAFIPQMGKWVMLYNATNPRGIIMRTATNPWGSWSSSKRILEPWGDQAYGRYMHVPSSFLRMDAFHDLTGPGAGEGTFGGEYGPYLIPRFTRGDATTCQLYYTMSTWNPYQTVVMRGNVGTVPPAAPDLSSTLTLTPGSYDWNTSSGAWFDYFMDWDQWLMYMTTYRTSDSNVGITYKWLPRDQWNQKLKFRVHGGHAEVLLIEGGGNIPVGTAPSTLYTQIKNGVYGDVIQCTWGHDSNVHDFAVDWDLRPFDRANLKVVVIDKQTDPWGFVTVSEMKLHRNAPNTYETLVLGDGNWNKYPGSWYVTQTFNWKPGITTYVTGDGNQGYMWRWLPRDIRNDRLKFHVHGGHAKVFLLEGGGSIPTDVAPAAVYSNIMAGNYGTIRGTAQGDDTNAYDIPIDWDLRELDKANLKVVIIDSLTGPWGWVGVSNMELARSVPLSTYYRTPAGDGWDWNVTPGSWYSTFNRNGIPHISTYLSSDSNQGIMWAWMPRDWKNSYVNFTVHGGHAKVYLIEGGGAIPVTGSMSTVHADILAGKYGKVVETVTGPDNNNVDIPVLWNLSKYDSANLKVVIIDSLSEPWGFISVSRMTVNRYNP